MAPQPVKIAVLGVRCRACMIKCHEFIQLSTVLFVRVRLVGAPSPWPISQIPNHLRSPICHHRGEGA